MISNILQVLQVFGQGDRGHAATAQLAVDGVSVGKGLGKLIQRLGHGSTVRLPIGP